MERSINWSPEWTVNCARRIGNIANCLDELVDPAVGIVECVNEQPLHRDSPRLFCYKAIGANTAGLGFQNNFTVGFGASLDRSTAMARAVGEVIERYCAAIYEPQDLKLATAKSASFPCHEPTSFALYSADQYAASGFPWHVFNSNTRIRWQEAKCVRTGETVFVPAVFVWLPYTSDTLAGDATISQSISTGLACHRTRAEAIRAGLLEVVERDCFMIAWLAKMNPPHLDHASLGPTSKEMIQRFEDADFAVHLLDITLDNEIPCCLAVLEGKNSLRPSYVFAAAASTCGSSAVQKALEELGLLSNFGIQLWEERQGTDLCEWSQIVTREDHFRFGADWNNRQLFEPLLSSAERLPIRGMMSECANPVLELELLVQKVANTGHEVLVVDITSPDIAHLDLHVYRTIIPGYQPLAIGHNYRHLGGHRIYEVPRRLGLPGPTTPNETQCIPHPFA